MQRLDEIGRLLCAGRKHARAVILDFGGVSDKLIIRGEVGDDRKSRWRERVGRPETAVERHLRVGLLKLTLDKPVKIGFQDVAAVAGVDARLHGTRHRKGTVIKLVNHRYFGSTLITVNDLRAESVGDGFLQCLATQRLFQRGHHVYELGIEPEERWFALTKVAGAIHYKRQLVRGECL